MLAKHKTVSIDLDSNKKNTRAKHGKQAKPSHTRPKGVAQARARKTWHEACGEEIRSVKRNL